MKGERTADCGRLDWHFEGAPCLATVVGTIVFGALGEYESLQEVSKHRED